MSFAKNGVEEKIAKKMDLKIADDFMHVDQNYQLKNGEKFALITEGKDGKAAKYIYGFTVKEKYRGQGYGICRGNGTGRSRGIYPCLFSGAL